MRVDRMPVGAAIFGTAFNPNAGFIRRFFD
jgi:hypothetical protein